MKIQDLSIAEQLESAWQEANVAQTHLTESLEFIGHMVDSGPDEVDPDQLAKIQENLRAIQAELIPAVSALRAL